MTIAQTFLPEFEFEMAKTRTCLERIPVAALDWSPHEKSMTFRALATHLSNLPSWAVMTVHRESFDVAPPDAEPPRAEPIESVEAALATLDRNVADAKAAIAGASNDTLRAPWTLLAGGRTVFSFPRAAVLRNMVLSHMIHHRAQLGVYLRLRDVPVPAVYGPTADEGSL